MSAMLACSLEASKEIVEQAKLFKVTVSFGNVTSQISLPCFMSHASIPAEVRAARGLPDDLIRISAGIEDANDLIKGILSPIAFSALPFCVLTNCTSLASFFARPFTQSRKICYG